MKIILTGSTGFIGTEILKQCISHCYITHIHILTRRPLDSAEFSHKKVTQHLLLDFENYPTDLLTHLRSEGISACIFALGGKISQFKDLDEARQVGVNYPAAAAEAFAQELAPALTPYDGYERGLPPKAGQERFPFRFIFISAAGAEQDQFKKLWIANDSRKIKGAAEKAIFGVVANAEEKEGGYKCFEAIALRPGTVLRGRSDDTTTLITEAVYPSIAVDRLARTAIKCAFDGVPGQQGKTILENRDCLGEDWAMMNSLNI